VLEEKSAEFEIRPEPIQRRGGGDQLEIARGDERDFGIVFEEGFVGFGGIAEVDDFNSNFSAVEGLVLEDGLNVAAEIGM